MYHLDRHPGEDQLEAFALGRLQGEELTGLEEHLFLCEQCRIRLETLDEFMALLREALASTDHATGNGRSRAAWSGSLKFGLSED
jgi:anti-sigma factor RsiW